MPIDPLNRRYWYQYVSDTGETVAVQLSARTANTGGFSPVSGGEAPAVRQLLRMRHVDGVTADGSRRHVLPVPSVANALYQGTDTTFGFDGDTFIVTGMIGEKRRAPKVP